MLTPNDQALLRTVIDRIVPADDLPSATEFGADAFILDILEGDARAVRELIVYGLRDLDRRGFLNRSTAEQDAILQAASTADSGRAGGKTTLRDQFETLKGWISGAYYSSEQGMKELGWTGNVFHAELPGCTHPGGHSG